MIELSRELSRAIDSAEAGLRQVSEIDSMTPVLAGGWSRKQVIGHLIDSAGNNLGRIVRLQIEAGQSLPGYEQMAWVSLQHYAEREWAQALQAQARTAS